MSEIRKNPQGGVKRAAGGTDGVRRTAAGSSGNARAGEPNGKTSARVGAAVRNTASVRQTVSSQSVGHDSGSAKGAPQKKTASVQRTVQTRKPVSSNEWTSETRTSSGRASHGKNAQGSFFGGKLKLDFLSKKEIDWPVLVAAGVCVIILLGIIALLIVGISRCSSGCGGKSDQTASSTKSQIYLSTTPAPEKTPFVEEPKINGGEIVPENTPVPVPTIVAALNVMNQEPTQNTEGLRSATIRTLGDFVIHKEVFQSAQRLAKATNVKYQYNFAPMIDPVWDVIGNADFTVANVDGCLGGKSSYKYGYSGYPQFNTPEYLLFALRDSSVDMLTLANNHMLDGWFDGLMNTIKNVETVGIKHVGASRTQEERNSAVIYEINGIKVGFLNYTQSLNSMDRQKGLDARAMKFAVHATSNSNCATDAKRLREAGADVIVCFMHWGEEDRREPDTNQKNLAKKLVDCGVDVIIGGHPHMVQKAEWLSGTNQFGEKQETLCLYSLGNFLSFQREQYKDGGIIFDFTIQEQADGSFSIVNPGYLPIWVWMTGTDASNYNFSVLNISEYINNPPANMSSADYQKMLTSYNDSISVMNTGVGALLKK